MSAAPGLRVLLVTSHYPPSLGGVETHVAELAARLAGAGHAVEVAAQTSDRALARDEVVAGVRIRRFPSRVPSDALALAPALLAHVARAAREVDVVHVHNYHGAPFLSALATRGTPLVLTPHYHGGGHSTLARVAHVPYGRLAALALRRATAIICVSEAERTRLVERHPGLAARCRVIPNGIDVAAIRAAAPTPRDGAPRILALGRLVPHKRVALLVEALAASAGGARLDVVGSGPAESAVAARVRELGLEERVVLHGRLGDAAVHGLLRGADVVASLSTDEAFGIVPLEGVAAGAAVVASAIPAYVDVLSGLPGVALVPVDAAASEVARALDAALAAGRPGAAAAARIRTWDEVAELVLDVYREVRR